MLILFGIVDVVNSMTEAIVLLGGAFLIPSPYIYIVNIL